MAADLDWNAAGQAERACDDFVAQVFEEGGLVEEATDPEPDSGSSRASASSEEDWSGSADEAEELGFTGPWLLNAKAGRRHKTAVVSSEPCVRRLACQPQLVLHAGYMLDNPCGTGFSACQHVGCFGNFTRASEPTSLNPLPYNRHGHTYLAARCVTIIGRGRALAHPPPHVLGSVSPLVNLAIGPTNTKILLDPALSGAGGRAFKATSIVNT